MKNSKYRLFAVLLLVILLVSVLISACNVDDLAGGIGTQSAAPDKSAIFSPTTNTTVILGSPVQVQSAHKGKNISRVELWVNGELVRADIPDNGRITQKWIPRDVGPHTINVKAVNLENEELTNLPTTIHVQDNTVVVVVDDVQPRPQENAPSGENQVLQDEIEETVPASADVGSAYQAPAASCASEDRPVLHEFTIDGNDYTDVKEITGIAVAQNTAQAIIIRWTFSNADRVLLEIQEPNGSIQRIPVSPVDEYTYTFTSNGRFIIRLTATNDKQCGLTEEKTVEVSPKVIVTDTPTPIPGGVHPTAVPTPTATPYYPPPPPAPGVPYGRTQAELPELMPPVCDAAQFIGVYVPNTGERITIKEDDVISAKTVGGTLVHRAWRLQNVGTCTWGPGYELAFYGGRSMGSGGVAFESFFPNEPDRRNIVQNNDRIIAAEGKPNQVAVLEVLLNAPVTPGIHQSYWRMRNPQGVYFGPIVGVTLEVVRECKFGIYGAPVINKFEILGVGDVFRPENPIDVMAELGQPVTLDWSIINADNYDIIVKSPTGQTANLSTNNNTDRNSFIPNQVGQYILTLYADNGPCTAMAEVLVDVIPPNDTSAFRLEILRASNNPDDLIASWDHKDSNVNDVVLTAKRYERKKGPQCILFDYNTWPTGLRQYTCDENQWGDWTPVSGQPLPTEIVGVGGPTAAAGIARTSPELSAQSAVTVGDQTVAQGTGVSVATTVGSTPQGSATVSNIEWGLCPSSTDPNVDIAIRYQSYAKINGVEAQPTWSNVVDVRCGGIPGASGNSAGTSTTPPPNPNFNPD